MKSVFSVQVTIQRFTCVDSVKSVCSAGCFAHGLFLEGAAWDLQTGTIFKQQPKQLIQPLPILKISPIESHRLKLQVSSSVPEYDRGCRR